MILAAMEHTQVAMCEGVTVSGVVYKASICKGSTEFGDDLKHVQFTLMRIVVDKTIFLSDLMESLSYFGKVLQLKKFTYMGYFCDVGYFGWISGRGFGVSGGSSLR